MIESDPGMPKLQLLYCTYSKRGISSSEEGEKFCVPLLCFFKVIEADVANLLKVWPLRFTTFRSVARLPS